MSAERLSAIAGRWRTSGYVFGDPPVPVEGTDVYEVLPGGHFLVHRVDVTVGGREVRAIEVIGEPEPDSDAYLARSFDSEGKVEMMKLQVDDDGIFRFTGGGDIAPAAHPSDAPTAQVRSTLTVSQDRASMTAFWERSENGIDWEPWMHITFTPSHGSTQIAVRESADLRRSARRLKGDDPMIVEYIRYKIDPGRTGEFDDAYRRAGALLDASPHCQHWEASRCVDEPEKQIVRIEWDSAEGHLQGFRKSADFKPFVEATRPFFNDIEEMTHYLVTANGREER